MRPGDELGQFGFGSTTIVLLPAGAARIPDLPRETVVRMGAAVPEASGPGPASGLARPAD